MSDQKRHFPPHAYNWMLMDWQNLYQKQLNENQDLKKQLDIVESILRNFLPVVEPKDEQN